MPKGSQASPSFHPRTRLRNPNTFTEVASPEELEQIRREKGRIHEFLMALPCEAKRFSLLKPPNRQADSRRFQKNEGKGFAAVPLYLILIGFSALELKLYLNSENYPFDHKVLCQHHTTSHCFNCAENGHEPLKLTTIYRPHLTAVTFSNKNKLKDENATHIQKIQRCPKAQCSSRCGKLQKSNLSWYKITFKLIFLSYPIDWLMLVPPKKIIQYKSKFYNKKFYKKIVKK